MRLDLVSKPIVVPASIFKWCSKWSKTVVNWNNVNTVKEFHGGSDLFTKETQRKYGEYRELASSLAAWMRENTIVMQDRQFPSTLIEVKKLATDSSRFRTEEIPHRLREKQHITRLYKDIEVSDVVDHFWHDVGLLMAADKKSSGR